MDVKTSVIKIYVYRSSCKYDCCSTVEEQEGAYVSSLVEQLMRRGALRCRGRSRSACLPPQQPRRRPEMQFPAIEVKNVRNRGYCKLDWKVCKAHFQEMR